MWRMSKDFSLNCPPSILDADASNSKIVPTACTAIDVNHKLANSVSIECHLDR